MFEQFKNRSNKLERLDTGDYTDAEYEKWQREMHFIQRFYGEWRALEKSLEDIQPNARILDVGAGSGELLQFIKRKLAPDAVVVGVELEHKASIEMYRRGLNAVLADGISLPFAEDSFDFAICSLTLHHLDNERAIRLLADMKRVASQRIYVIDLHRTPISYYFYKIVGRLFLQRLTLEDGALSILRGFTPDELVELGKAAGLTDISAKHSKAGRLVLSGQ